MNREDRDAFVASRRERWERLEYLLRVGPDGGAGWSELAASYRAICADLARAQSHQLPGDIQAYLDELASRAHNALYGTRRTSGLGLIDLVIRDFPREVRAHAVLFTVANLLFYGPLLVGIAGTAADPGFAAMVLPEALLAQADQAFHEANSVRSAGQNSLMAGFYVYNNVGIAFRCFATGALFGVGSVFYMAYNGLMIGTMLGHIAATGRALNILTWIAGHSAWELTGIVVAGTAGLKLGMAMIDTGGRTRLGSIRAAGPSLYKLIAGATVLLLVAAAIEGFWSASPVPPPLKWAFGVLQVFIVGAWLFFGGRRS